MTSQSDRYNSRRGLCVVLGTARRPAGRASSAIDTMANIPLLYWAAKETGDDSFVLAGEAHAAMTERNFVRSDRTLYHAVEYDDPTGSRTRAYTFQGYSDEFSWSRGAGWAVYGFAATAAATGRRHHLDRAVALATTWLEQLGDRSVLDGISPTLRRLLTVIPQLRP